MKKLIVTAVIAVLGCVAVTGQSIKINKDEYLKKIEKSDEDIANAKKNTKANVWLERGKIFSEAGAVASTSIWRDVDVASLKLFFGEPEATSQKEIGGVMYEANEYPHATIYIAEGFVKFWEPKLKVADNAFDEAYKAYHKAYQLDGKSAEKVKEGIIALANEVKKEADNYYYMQDFAKAGDSFIKAYEYQKHPAVNVEDNQTLLNGGLSYDFGGEYAKAIQYLTQAIDKGMEDSGDTYYYLYVAYFSMQDYDKAKEVLKTAIQKFPGNYKIVEGLILVYSETDGDIQEIIPLVEKTIENEPDNAILWNGLAGIYLKLEDFDKAIETYEKALSLEPNNFFNNMNIGYAYIALGDKMNQELNASASTSAADYNKAQEDINNVYAKSIAPLEAALAIDPSSAITIELLKNVTFRLRDRDGIQAKYDKYTEMFNNLPPAE